MRWFQSQDRNPAPASVTPITATPYHIKMVTSRDELHWFVKKHSNVISAEVYSEIRELERALKVINVFLEDHKPNASDEHLFDSIMHDYLPSAIELFTKLPDSGKIVGGEGDKLLLKQCRTMTRDLRERNTDLHDRATKDLRVQAAFIEERFNDANLT